MYQAKVTIVLNRVKFMIGIKELAVLTSMSQMGSRAPYLQPRSSLNMAKPRNTDVALDDSPMTVPITAVEVVIVTRKL
jgi:hypothetical protein